MFFNRRPQTIGSFFCSDMLGLAYLRIPKSGCTVLEDWMAKNHPAYDWDRPHSVHSREAISNYFDQVRADEQGIENYITFTFVRHPVRRLESFYRDKIMSAKPEQMIFDNVNCFGIYHGMSYKDCVQALVNIKKPDLLNPHVAPQYYFLLRDGKQSRVQHIYRLENFSADFARLQALSRVNTEVEPANKNIYSGRKYCDFSLPDKLQDRLVDFFRPDFTLLGYEV